MIDNLSPAKLFVFGLGYTALRLAGHLLTAGWTVAGTCRSAENAALLRRRGIDAHPFDRARPMSDPASVLRGATHILDSIPPDEAGDPAIDCHGAAIAALPDLRWVGYLSTTGVYGDAGGDWVDEGSPAGPTDDRGRRRLAAENAWLGLLRDANAPVHVFRLAGIYGPGRSVLDLIRSGTARRIIKPGHVFSRIHVDDIVRILAASMERPDPGAVYNLSDDEPASNADVVACGCSLLGVPAPPEIPIDAADLSPMARSFYADSRRVRNERIKRDLGIALRYPSYREGLAAILSDPGES